MTTATRSSNDKFALLIIDPQVRSCFPPCLNGTFFASHNQQNRFVLFHFYTHQVDFHGGGSLAVPGADENARRIQAFVEKHLDDITSIFVTLDSHQVCVPCSCSSSFCKTHTHTHIHTHIHTQNSASTLATLSFGKMPRLAWPHLLLLPSLTPTLRARRSG